MGEGYGLEGYSFLGKVSHVFRRIGCVGIKIKNGIIRPGDEIEFYKEEFNKEPSRDFILKAKIISIEINHEKVKFASAGQECAVKLSTGNFVMPPNNARVSLVNCVADPIDGYYPPNARVMEVDDADLAP